MGGLYEMNKGFRLTVSLSSPLIMYCLIRVSLVASSRMRFFSLPLVIAASLVIFALDSKNNAFMNALKCSNVIIVLLQVCCVAVSMYFCQSSTYNSYSAVYVRQLLFIITLCILYAKLECISADQKKRMLMVYGICMLISCIQTFKATELSDDLIRTNVAGYTGDEGTGVFGGYDFIYALVIVYVALLSAVQQNWRRNIFYTGLLLLCCLLILLTLIRANFTTALILIVAYTIVAISWKNTKLRIAALFMLVLLPLMLPVIAGVIDKMDFIPSLTRSRIVNVLQSLYGAAVDESLSGEGQRIDRIIWSLRIIAENPIWGGYTGNTGLSFGYHTEWIEQFARYGVLYGALMCLFWRNTYKNLIRFCSEKSARTVRDCFIIFCILGFLNPISMVVTAAPLFVFSPFINLLFEA